MSSSENSRYGHLGLETNPFPFTPVPRRPWILGGKSRIEICNRIKNEIMLSKNLNEPKINVVLGDYGYGKTHIAEHLINYVLSSRQFKIFIHTIQDPNNKPTLSFFSIKLLNSLGSEKFLRELASKILLKVVTKKTKDSNDQGIIRLSIKERILCLIENKYKEQVLNEVVSTLKEDPEAIQKLVKEGRIDDEHLIKLAEDDIKGTFDTERKSISLRNFVDLNIFREILLFPFSDYWKYYSRSRYDELINKVSKSEEDALTFITTLISLMRYASEETVVLVVDEVDALSPMENVDLFFHSLRELVDRGPGGLYILLLCTPRAWGNYLQNNQLGNVRALESRIGTRPIVLENISLEEAKDIINKYLEAVALRKEERMYEKIFDPNVIEFLYRKSLGNIRQLLVFCFYCIEYVSQNKLSKVNYNVAENVTQLVPSEKLPEIPLEPDSDITTQIVRKFFSIEKPVERGKLLEKAIGEIISKGLGSESNLGKRRINVGLRKKREVDIVFYDSMKRINGIEVKAYNKERLIELKQLEGFIELIKNSTIENFILLSTSKLSISAKKELDELGKHKNVRVHILDEKQIATIFYSTNTFPELGRQIELKKEEAINILKNLGILII
ncbi:MAG: hypothetical protein QW768_05490 [Thermoproteota archaeon]